MHLSVTSSYHCILSCRVRGLSQLRIADASIMPTIVSGDPSAATIMIAEKGADLILGRVSVESANVTRSHTDEL